MATRNDLRHQSVYSCRSCRTAQAMKGFLESQNIRAMLLQSEYQLELVVKPDTSIVNQVSKSALLKNIKSFGLTPIPVAMMRKVFQAKTDVSF